MNYLEKFQAENGLKADNKIGRITFNMMSKVFGIQKEDLAYWLGQVAHETNMFKYGTENLNYSEKGLRKYFRKYFFKRNNPIRSLSTKYKYKYQEYAKRPKMIANLVYGGRMGNNKKNDGWYFRGRFCIQITGFNNYREFQSWIDINSECPDYILDDLDMFIDKYYWLAGLFYFEVNNIFNKTRDITNTIERVKSITKMVNGGRNGLKHRIKLTEKYLKLC